ncbi:hypothetical protein ACQEVB_14010 [Pseudonocardia sp. CA-107938]|uniref:hypothetical protein n=1 Tax=Pseudonocardia sp. CA-107938 TaxID=3240021 RepID=UPI003D8F16F9
MAGRWQYLPLVFCVALGLYAVSFWLDSPALLRLLVWFVGAAVVHDLVLFPLYTAADRALARLPVPARNHVRVPALAAGLTLLVFLPGIVRQGTASNVAATGLDQEPFLGRWVVFTLAVFAVSGAVYAARLLLTRRSAAGG